MEICNLMLVKVGIYKAKRLGSRIRIPAEWRVTLEVRFGIPILVVLRTFAYK
jgi:hypothetical protein